MFGIWNKAVWGRPDTLLKRSRIYLEPARIDQKLLSDTLNGLESAMNECVKRILDNATEEDVKEALVSFSKLYKADETQQVLKHRDLCGSSRGSNEDYLSTRHRSVYRWLHAITLCLTEEPGSERHKEGVEAIYCGDRARDHLHSQALLSRMMRYEILKPSDVANVVDKYFKISYEELRRQREGYRYPFGKSGISPGF